MGATRVSHPPPVEWYRTRRFESWWVHAGVGAGGCHTGCTGIRTADQIACGRLRYHSATADSEVIVLPTAWTHVCSLKKTQSVCFCLTDCWPV